MRPTPKMFSNEDMEVARTLAWSTVSISGEVAIQICPLCSAMVSIGSGFVHATGKPRSNRDFHLNYHERQRR